MFLRLLTFNKPVMLRRIVCQMVKVAKRPLTMSSRLISTYPHLSKEFEETQYPAMEPGVSYVTLMGRVGSDPVSSETEFGTSGIVIMAVNMRTGNKAVGYKKETIWFKILIHREGELKVMTRTGKGDRVFVQGHLLPVNPAHVKENVAPKLAVSAVRFINVKKKIESEEQKHSEEEEMDQW